MKPFELTPAQRQAWDDDGYLTVPNLFDAEEMELLLNIGRADKHLQENAHGPKDAEGMISRLWLTGELDEDIYSAFVRSPRVAGTMAELMGDEVYHYHHKMMLKEPRVGGAGSGHQDYGYWYHNGCLFPDMASCMIAVEPRPRRRTAACRSSAAPTRWAASSTAWRAPRRSGPGQGRPRAGASRVGLLRDGARHGVVLPRQPAPPQRPEP